MADFNRVAHGVNIGNGRLHFRVYLNCALHAERKPRFFRKRVFGNDADCKKDHIRNYLFTVGEFNANSLFERG